MSLSLFDGSNTLINTTLFTLTTEWQTVSLGYDNITKVVIDFLWTGDDFYGDGRDHSWYVMDNITYDTSNNLYSVSEVPVSAAVFFFAPALLGFMGLRLRRKAKSPVA